MKHLIGLILLASLPAWSSEVCHVWVDSGPVSPSAPPPASAKGMALCTSALDNIEVTILDRTNAGVKARLTVIKMLTEKGFVLNGDGVTMVKK